MGLCYEERKSGLYVERGCFMNIIWLRKQVFIWIILGAKGEVCVDII